ncbi:MAG: branched-chain amino acid ABC transporter permease [Actinomycetota bacterium]|nr:branched-chain amino acid ABC transporter permease [Actinomycetota bacterium]
MIQQLVNALVLGSVFLLFSLGLSLAWGTLDVLNLAHGALFVLGAYLTYELGVSTSLPVVVVALIGMVGCGLAATVLEITAFGPIRVRMRSKRQAELGVLVASLGGATIIGQLISNATRDQIFAQRVFEAKQYHVAGIVVSNIDGAIVIIALVVATAIHLVTSRSHQGRAVRALAVDPVTAGLMGINVRLVALGTMFVSGALAGLAGVLLSFGASGMTVSSGDAYMLSAFAILVVGGVGSILGACITSYAVAIAETAVVAYGPSNYETGVAFGLILLFLIVRPTGLFAKNLAERV